MAESGRESKKACSNTMDFFSHLPDDIIHNIISLLNSMDGIKFTVLSKRFRFVLYSSPNIDYTDEDFVSPRNFVRSGDMIRSLSRSIIHRSVGPRNMIDVEKFRLRATPGDKISRHARILSASSNLNTAIVYAVQHNVKELDYCFPCFWKQLYRIPIDVFTSQSVRVLKLEFIEITSSILNSMTELEIVRILWCKVPEDFIISGYNIKRMNLCWNSGCKTIEIAAPNLEFVSYTDSDHEIDCDISFIDCKNVRQLFLDTDNISDEWLAYHLLGFPCLEVLKLYSCRRLRNINISSESNDQLRKVYFNSFTDNIRICNSNLKSVGLRDSFTESFFLDILTCKNLTNLRLYHVHVTDYWLDDILPQFYFLEKLKLVGCTLLRTLYIRSRKNIKLKTIELQSLLLRNIYICNKHLESFIYITRCEGSCDIDLNDCKGLKILRLSGITIGGRDWLENGILPMPFPLLEQLTLHDCRFLKKTDIHGNLNRLRDMQLSSCNQLKKVDVHASHLTSFTYSGEPPFPALFIDSPLRRVKLSLGKGPGFIPKEDFLRMICRVLIFFGHCEVVELNCNDALIMMTKQLRNSLPSPLVNVRHLEVEMCKLSNLEKLLEGLFWVTPRPETISFWGLLGNKSMLSFQYAAEVDDEEPVYYLNHHLREVNMDNFDENEVNVLSSFFRREAIHLESISFNVAASS